MKTHVNYYRIHYQEWSMSLMIILLLMAMSACTEDTDPPILGPLRTEVNLAEQYIGEYELMPYSTHPQKIIAIEQFTLIYNDEFLLNQPGTYQVYISNLVDGHEAMVAATWNGYAYTIDSQKIMVGHAPTTVSGKLTLFRNELMVYYHLDGKGEVRTYAERFRKLDQ